MAYWKFISTEKTEVECFLRELFGNPGKRVNETGTKLNVEEGDTIFLHRLKFDGPGRLDGPFIAASDAGRRLSPRAWEHKGGIDWQVEIDWENPVYSISVDEINDEEDPTVLIEDYAQKLSEVQGLWLEGKLKDGIQTVSYP